MVSEKLLSVLNIHYSKKEVQNEIYNFCKNREIVPRYGEGFGKRPDTLEYGSEIMQHVKKGATSFHCSEEIWSDPLNLSTDLQKEQLDEMRKGWDLLIDIDCPWFDYSKKAAQAVTKTLEQHGVKSIGIKFSGSKGFHIIVPWTSFPKEINHQKTSEMFPELPKKIVAYIRFYAEKLLKDSLPENFYSHFKKTDIKKGIKCRRCNEVATEYELVTFNCRYCNRQEVKKNYEKTTKPYKCPECRKELKPKDSIYLYECKKCKSTSQKDPDNFTKTIEVDLFDLMGLDMVLVSSRHLFRVPYSLHEKTGLVSIVLEKNELENFQPKDADPLKVKIKSFYPKVKEEEARELVMLALDWNDEETKKKNETNKKEYKEFVIDRKKLEFPPCIHNILKGLKDGQRRSLFILTNFFRNLNFSEEEIREKIDEWNKKNKPSLKEGYINSQLSYTFKRKTILPPNCEKHYKDIKVCTPSALCARIKNPLNYALISMNRFTNNKRSKKKTSSSATKVF